MDDAVESQIRRTGDGSRCGEGAMAVSGIAMRLTACGENSMGDSTIAAISTGTCARNAVGCMVSAQAFDFSGAW